MKNMDCKDIKALLSAIIDDELDVDRRHAAERHLADCADCRAIVSEAEGLTDLIALDAQAKADATTLPMGFEQRVLERTVHAEHLYVPHRTWSMWTGWFAAAASLTLAAVVWLGNQPADPGQESIALLTPESVTDPALHEPSQSRVVTRPASYTTGVNLRSQTYDGGLPAEAFRVRNATLSDVTIPHDPIFDDLSVTGPAVATASAETEHRSEPRPAPLHRADADSLYSASLLIEIFADSDLTSFVEVDRIREVIEHDELLLRLATARERVTGPDRAMVFAAESVLLRIAHGPLDRDDAIELQAFIDEINLASEIEAMSDR
jgi:hypothetical protein